MRKWNREGERLISYIRFGGYCVGYVDEEFKFRSILLVRKVRVLIFLLNFFMG